MINRNRNINRGFRKLQVWQEAIDLFVFVKKKIDILKGISYNVKVQIEDSAFSVYSNIAEACLPTRQAFDIIFSCLIVFLIIPNKQATNKQHLIVQ